MSISGEIGQQVTGALELSAESRTGVEEAAEFVDSVAARLTGVFAASGHQGTEQVLQLLALARQRIEEICGLLGRVDHDLPVFLARLGQPPAAVAPGGTARRAAPDEPVEFTAWWGTTSRRLADPGDAETVIKEAASRFPADRRGVTIRIGDRSPEQAPLRVDIAADGRRAAVTWRGVPGYEPGVDADRDLVLDTPKDGPPVTVPADRARVTPEAAIRAAREYVSTGRAPTHLRWGSGESRDERTAGDRRPPGS